MITTAIMAAAIEAFPLAWSNVAPGQEMRQTSASSLNQRFTCFPKQEARQQASGP